MVAIMLRDKGEFELPKMGIVQVQNYETGNVSWVNSNNEYVRENYKRTFLDKQESSIQLFRKSGIDYTLIDTDEDFVLPLVNLFKHRKK